MEVTNEIRSSQQNDVPAVKTQDLHYILIISQPLLLNSFHKWLLPHWCTISLPSDFHPEIREV